MTYKDKILFNPTGKEVEFMCGGLIYILGAGEKRLFEGFVAHHALKEVHTGLVEYEGQDSEPMSDFAKMPWRQLVSLGSTEGVFKPGMAKDELIKALEGLDGDKAGAIPESTSEEEA